MTHRATDCERGWSTTLFKNSTTLLGARFRVPQLETEFEVPVSFPGEGGGGVTMGAQRTTTDIWE